MLKKYIAILFLSISFATLLWHSIIPHHHHDTEQELAEHFETNHHNDSEENSRDFSHHLSHFVHSADDFTIQNTHNINNTFSKQFLSLVAVLPYNYFFDELLIPPLLHKSPSGHFIALSPHSHSSDLRAPPAFIS